MTVDETAIGLVECRGMVAAMAAVEAMCKTADVTCVLVEKVSGGVLVTAVRGDLASVSLAVQAGAAAAERYGQLRATQVYPRPEPAVAELLTGALGRWSGPGGPASGTPAPSGPDVPATKGRDDPCRTSG
nr:BMC domain-containing protein [Micromonospora tarapacensis]